MLVGTGDSGAEAISTGVFRPGDIMVQMGSSCYFVYLTDHLLKEARLWPGTFIILGVYSVCAGTNTAGTLTKWMRDEFYKRRRCRRGCGRRKRLCGHGAGGCGHSGGQRWPGVPAVFCGRAHAAERPVCQGRIFWPSVNHTRAHLVKAGLEGIAYTIAAHLDLWRKNMASRCAASWRWGRHQNPVWLQAVADVTGREICTAKVTFGAAFGDAIMAALAGGAYASWDELAKVVTADRVIRPDMAAHAV